MKLIVGLGNPGEKYFKNRHNTGFIIVDEIASKNSLSWENSSKFNAEIAVSKDFILAKPQTYMNKSGEAVFKILNFYKVDTSDLVVIHDDVDLQFGEIKKQLGVSSAGHKGVESIIEKLSSQDFWRIRVGVGKSEDKNIPTDDWVLQNFTDEQLEKIKSKVSEIVF
ncbi:MAG: aminoacyl-tRNA hydrolase [Patescibacteria group bacterium]|nr:aminoacyl-tRNA hydrolase [Patescibacteria group bacterium]MBU1953286.1 aminoacyl-tRNA hydrolase [Patescibacteria group bacterium]